MNDGDSGNDCVDDEEILLRSIRDASDEYTFVDGVIRFSTNAFKDRGRKPSLDRLRLRDSASDSLKSPSDGVITLVTSEIRGISNVKKLTAKQVPITTYVVDVKPDPLPTNISHCQVICEPALEDDTVFRKLREALAQLANRRDWLIRPASLRSLIPGAS